MPDNPFDHPAHDGLALDFNMPNQRLSHSFRDAIYTLNTLQKGQSGIASPHRPALKPRDRIAAWIQYLGLDVCDLSVSITPLTALSDRKNTLHPRRWHKGERNHLPIHREYHTQLQPGK